MSSPVTTEVLPSELRLGPPPTMPQARSYLFKQQSDLQEYDVQLGNCIKINIPRLQRTYLTKDSYIRFRVNVDMIGALSGLWFDRVGAMGLFDRLEVYDYLGGTLLERVSDLPFLYTLLTDLKIPFGSQNGKYQAAQGMGLTSDLIFGGADAYLKKPSGNNTASTGMTFLPGNVTTNRNQSIEFCIPIPSFLGLFSDKFIPLHNGFTLNLYLNSTNNAFVSRYDNDDIGTEVVVKDCWLTNVELCCQVIELGDQAEALVMGSNGNNPWVIPCLQYRTFRNQVESSDPAFRLDMNLNVVSLRNVRFTMTPSSYFNALAYPLYGHRMRNFLQSFNFQYGSSYLPELAGINCRGTSVPNTRNGYTQNKNAEYVYGGNQAYAELLKTTDGNWSIMSSDSPINFSEYRVETAFNTNGNEFTGFNADPNIYAVSKGVTGSIPGKFAGGIDLRLNNKAIVSGIDTNGLLVCLNGTFDSRFVANRYQCILLAHAEYDAFIQIIPGVATTVTF